MLNNKYLIINILFNASALSGYFLQADGGSAACCLGRCLSGLPLFALASDFVTQL